MPSQYRFYYFLAVSVIIHGFLLAFLPAPAFQPESPKEKYYPVTVVRTTFSEPAESFEETVEVLEAMKKLDTIEAESSSQADQAEENILLSVPELNFQSENLQYQRSFDEPVLDPGLTVHEQDARLLPPDLAEVEIPDSWQNSSSMNHLSSLPEEEDAKISVNNTPELEFDVPPEAEQIEGPVASRELTFKPPPPTAQVSQGAVITLKFWVFPDGTVGKIVPLKKGNAELEQIAIQYLQQWRFSPLSSEVKQEDQWGIIPIKFSVI